MVRLFVLICLVFQIVGCQRKEESPTQNVLRINFQDGDLPSTHPHFGIDYRMRSLQAALFEGLTRLDPDGIPQPAAAKTISISPDQTVYTFVLRPHNWSNGEPVRAHHFAEAWKNAIAKDSSCRRPDLFYLIKNSVKIKKGEVGLSVVGIRTLDEKTLEIELEHPAPYFLELISNPIFSPLYDDSQEPTVFNGPFIIDRWKHDQFLSLKKNALYWDAQNVALDAINISVVTDPLTAVHLFEKGELDWIGSPFSCLPSDMVPAFEKKGWLKTQDVARVYWLYCNNQKFPFNNASIRKALAYAIDRKAIVEHVLLGQKAANAPLPLSLTLVGAEGISETRDLSMAQHYFAQGLQELGLTLETFPPIILSHSHITGQRQLSEIIQSNWSEALGVHVNLEGGEWNVFFSNLSNGNYQIGGCLKSALFSDPIYHLELLEDMNHSYNVCRWENPVYQECLSLSRLAVEASERVALMRRAEKILVEEMPVIPIYSETYLYMVRPHIQGIVIHDLGHVDFKWTKSTYPKAKTGYPESLNRQDK